MEFHVFDTSIQDSSFSVSTLERMYRQLYRRFFGNSPISRIISKHFHAYLYFRYQAARMIHQRFGRHIRELRRLQRATDIDRASVLMSSRGASLTIQRPLEPSERSRLRAVFLWLHDNQLWQPLDELHNARIRIGGSVMSLKSVESGIASPTPQPSPGSSSSAVPQRAALIQRHRVEFPTSRITSVTSSGFYETYESVWFGSHHPGSSVRLTDYGMTLEMLRSTTQKPQSPDSERRLLPSMQMALDVSGLTRFGNPTRSRHPMYIPAAGKTQRDRNQARIRIIEEKLGKLGYYLFNLRTQDRNVNRDRMVLLDSLKQTTRYFISVSRINRRLEPEEIRTLLSNPQSEIEHRLAVALRRILEYQSRYAEATKRHFEVMKEYTREIREYHRWLLVLNHLKKSGDEFGFMANRAWQTTFLYSNRKTSQGPVSKVLMNFGRYKGRELQDIPIDYLIWVHEGGFRKQSWKMESFTEKDKSSVYFYPMPFRVEAQIGFITRGQGEVFKHVENMVALVTEYLNSPEGIRRIEQAYYEKLEYDADVRPRSDSKTLMEERRASYQSELRKTQLRERNLSLRYVAVKAYTELFQTRKFRKYPIGEATRKKLWTQARKIATEIIEKRRTDLRTMYEQQQTKQSKYEEFVRSRMPFEKRVKAFLMKFRDDRDFARAKELFPRFHRRLIQMEYQAHRFNRNPREWLGYPIYVPGVGVEYFNPRNLTQAQREFLERQAGGKPISLPEPPEIVRRMEERLRYRYAERQAREAEWREIKFYELLDRGMSPEQVRSELRRIENEVSYKARESWKSRYIPNPQWRVPIYDLDQAGTNSEFESLKNQYKRRENEDRQAERDLNRRIIFNRLLPDRVKMLFFAGEIDTERNRDRIQRVIEFYENYITRTLQGGYDKLYVREWTYLGSDVRRVEMHRILYSRTANEIWRQYLRPSRSMYYPVLRSMRDSLQSDNLFDFYKALKQLFAHFENRARTIITRRLGEGVLPEEQGLNLTRLFRRTWGTTRHDTLTIRNLLRREIQKYFPGAPSRQHAWHEFKKFYELSRQPSLFYRMATFRANKTMTPERYLEMTRRFHSIRASILSHPFDLDDPDYHLRFPQWRSTESDPTYAGLMYASMPNLQLLLPDLTPEHYETLRTKPISVLRLLSERKFVFPDKPSSQNDFVYEIGRQFRGSRSWRTMGGDWRLAPQLKYPEGEKYIKPYQALLSLEERYHKALIEYERFIRTPNKTLEELEDARRQTLREMEMIRGSLYFTFYEEAPEGTPGSVQLDKEVFRYAPVQSFVDDHENPLIRDFMSEVRAREVALRGEGVDVDEGLQHYIDYIDQRQADLIEEMASEPGDTELSQIRRQNAQALFSELTLKRDIALLRLTHGLTEAEAIEWMQLRTDTSRSVEPEPEDLEDIEVLPPTPNRSRKPTEP